MDNVFYENIKLLLRILRESNYYRRVDVILVLYIEHLIRESTTRIWKISPKIDRWAHI